MNDEVVQLLKSLERWLRISNLDKLSEVLRREFSEEEDHDGKKKAAYLLSNGEKSTREIGAHPNVNTSGVTVGRWWAKWAAKGLAEPASGRKSAVALWRNELATVFDLEIPKEESRNEPEQN